MASATAATAASYKKYNSKTGKWDGFPLYLCDIQHFIVTDRTGSSASEGLIFTNQEESHFPNIRFFPTKTYTYKLTDEGYVCIENPKESSLWSIYVDSEGTYYSYMTFGESFWCATKLELKILEPKL